MAPSLRGSPDRTIASSYKFQKMTPEILAATQKSWRAQLQRFDMDIPKTRYLQALAFAEELLEQKHESVFSYAIVYRGEDSKKACALLDISHARVRSNAPWLKVLSIRMEPRLDAAVDNPKIRELSSIAATALVGSIELTIDAHPSKELKVYGERPMDRSFLEGIVSNFPKLSAVDVAAHGNWLVITKK